MNGESLRFLTRGDARPIRLGRGLDRHMGRLWADESRRQRAEAVTAAGALLDRPLLNVEITAEGWYADTLLGFAGDESLVLNGCHRLTITRLQRQVDAARQAGLGEAVILRWVHDPGPFFGLYFDGPGGSLPLLVARLRAGGDVFAVA